MTDPTFSVDRVCIIGLGLIGGSLGLAWSQAKDGPIVVGSDEPDIVQKAVDRGAIHEGGSSIAHAVRDCDVIVIATPIADILKVLDQISDYLKPNAIVTDVGSVKVAIEDFSREVLPKNVTFFGGHPMAGSEKSGIENADAFLFENATYVLCPPSGFEEHPEAFDPFLRLIERTGARVLLMDSGRHDQIAATVSHVPQLVSVALASFVAENNERDDRVHKLAAGGFRDMTRIASSSFRLWHDILLANHSHVLDGLAAFSRHLQSLRNRIAEEDLIEVQSVFDSARTFRESVPKTSKGFLRPLSDVYVAAADRPGAILSIAQALYDKGINIKDMELLKLREGTGGTFRVGFESERDADAAVEALSAVGHQAHRL